MKGRKPKPSHLKLVAGTARADRTNSAEPKPAPVSARTVPNPPGHLSVRAQSAWRYVGDILARMGVLTAADGFALERLCECYADMREAQDSLKRPMSAQVFNVRTGELEDIEVAPGGQTSYVTRGKDGFLVRTRPEVGVIADADRRFRAYLGDFGLSPATRSKVKTDLAGAEQSDTDEFFS